MIRKAVIPAAGLGTRFLPATKAIPKEMLPVVDKPALQYVVEEAVATGLEDILVVLGRNKSAISNHFDSVPELESNLFTKSDDAKLAHVKKASELADLHFVRQGSPRGLGHAVSRAEAHVGREPFAVLLGGDLIGERETLLRRMIDVAENHAASVVALLEVDPEQIHLYGCASVEMTDQADVVRITGLVEKPASGAAPSNFAVIGRYVLRPEVFDVLRGTTPGKGGEIQLTDALERMASDPAEFGGVYGVIFRGQRYDTGDKLDHLKAIVEIASERPDLGPELLPWLSDFVSGRGLAARGSTPTPQSSMSVSR
ncbi:UTP--glucose-1-phosphate uridylyltransferase [Microbacterium sp.]|uniref:UTP--glucose-1-phosphate uridylyltransferase n=1 Tax=Microbacterium sp. TaxID=51671 RepID=UPI003C76BB68